jgi:DHA1 family tetracycline resistance protein-like MFS transporter
MSSARMLACWSLVVAAGAFAPHGARSIRVAPQCPSHAHNLRWVLSEVSEGTKRRRFAAPRLPSARVRVNVLPPTAPPSPITIVVPEELLRKPEPPQLPPPAPKKLDHRPLLPIYACVFTQWLGYGLGFSTMPMHMINIGFRATDLGLVQACFSLAMMLSCPLLVRLSRHRGRIPVLRQCLIVGTLSSFLLAAAGCGSSASPQRLAAMMGARMLAGMAGACIPVAQAAVSDVVTDPEQRANALAVVQASSSLGIVVGPPVAALLQGLFGSVIGLSTGFVFMAVFAIDGIVSALNYASLAGMKDAGAEEAEAEAPSTPRPVSSEVEGSLVVVTGAGLDVDVVATDDDDEKDGLPAAAAGELWRQYCFRAISFVCRWKMITGLSTYQLYAQRFLGYGPLACSAVLSLSAATQFGTQLLLLPRLLPRIGEHRTAALGLLLIGFGFGGCALTKVQPLHLLLYWSACIGLALAETAAAVLASRYARSERRRDANLASLQSTQACSNIFAPIAAGVMFERSAGAAALPGALPILFTGALALCAAPVALVVKKFDDAWEGRGRPAAATASR